VKVISRESDNGRIYPADVLLEALPLYQNVKVFVDHSEPRGKRSYADVLGLLRNVRFRQGSLFGDLHLNLKHPLSERLLYDAQHFPDHQIGLSHDASGEMSAGGVVKRIHRVYSVDLVAFPASTKTLHESLDDRFDWTRFPESLHEDPHDFTQTSPVVTGDEAIRLARQNREERARRFLERARENEHSADTAARLREAEQAAGFDWDHFRDSISY